MAAALVIPLSTATLAERRFENTMDRISGHLLSARLESMERRLPVEVIWTQGRMQTRVFDPDLVQPVSPGVMEEDVFTGDGLDPELAGPSEELQEAIEVLELPGGVTCLDSEPGLDEPVPGIPDDEVTLQTLRIAVYLPDGSVIERGPRWILDEDGRTAALWIDRRTGLPILNRRTMASSTEDEPEEEIFQGPDTDSTFTQPTDASAAEGSEP
ncbi:MAG: hypothetical protein VX527_11035 [Planctomycetota bacterium]|nr:hypothetical protein [Planctomycetota bacterium]